MALTGFGLRYANFVSQFILKDFVKFLPSCTPIACIISDQCISAKDSVSNHIDMASDCIMAKVLYNCHCQYTG